jgi:hypothetical protein
VSQFEFDLYERVQHYSSNRKGTVVARVAAGSERPGAPLVPLYNVEWDSPFSTLAISYPAEELVSLGERDEREILP